MRLDECYIDFKEGAFFMLCKPAALFSFAVVSVHYVVLSFAETAVGVETHLKLPTSDWVLLL